MITFATEAQLRGLAGQLQTRTGTALAVTKQQAIRDIAEMDLAVSPGQALRIKPTGDGVEATPSGSLDADLLEGQSGSFYLDRANHTSTQPASTISDFAEAVDDRVDALLVEGPNIALEYDDGSDTLTVTGYGAGSVGLQCATTGHYLDASTTTASPTTLAGAANRFELVPFIPTRDVAISAIGVNVTSGVASATMKVGIYEAGSDGFPNVLLVESTDLDCSTNGFKSFSYSATLEKGKLYWLFTRCSSTATTGTLTAASLRPINRTSLTAAQNVAIRVSLTYATAAPNPYGSVASGDLNNSLPHACFLVIA